jgi:hypothetical protein
MHDLVRIIFRRLETLDPSTDGQQAGDEEGNTELRMNVSPTREAGMDSIGQVLEVNPPEREKTPVPIVSDGTFVCFLTLFLLIAGL